MKSNGYGIASFVTSIIGLLLVLAPYFGIVFNILAIIFYCRQKKIEPNGLATAGFVIGVIGCVINGLILLVLLLTMVMLIGLS